MKVAPPSPWKKSPPLKLEVLSTPPHPPRFENLVEGSTLPPPAERGGGCTLWRVTFFYNLNRISYIHAWEEMFWVWRSSSLEKFIQFIISEIKHFLSFLSRSWIVWKFYCNSVLLSWHCWKVFSVEDFPKLNLPFLFRI